MHKLGHRLESCDLRRDRICAPHGFCTPDEYRRFLHQCPIFERLLVEDGIVLIKYWFSVSDEEQERRFRSRLEDPLRRWKLSPMDLESRARWVEYSRAKGNCIAHLLSVVSYEDVLETPVELPPRPAESDYQRPPRDLFRYVPDYAAKLLG